jgi:hypothetical protein
VFSETWPRWGTMLGGECSAQSMPGHLTSGIESGSWPAPTCNGWRSEGAILQLRKRIEDGTLTMDEAEAMAAGSMTPARMGFWPTPNCSNDRTPCRNEALLALKGMLRANGVKPQARLQDAAAFWPTPHGFSKDGRSNGPSGNELGRAVNQAKRAFPTPTVAAAKGSSPKSLTLRDGRSRATDWIIG